MKKLKLKYEALVYGLSPMENDYIVDKFTFRQKQIDLTKYKEVYDANPYFVNPTLGSWVIPVPDDGVQPTK